MKKCAVPSSTKKYCFLTLVTVAFNAHLFLIAHARLMFRDTVTVEDAVTVVSVMESSMQVRVLADVAIAAVPHLRDSVSRVDTSVPFISLERVSWTQGKCIIRDLDKSLLAHLDH